MSSPPINLQDWVYSPDNDGAFFLRNEELEVTIRSEAYKLSFTVYSCELIIDKDLIKMIEVYRIFHNEIIRIYKEIFQKQLSGREEFNIETMEIIASAVLRMDMQLLTPT